MTVDDKIWKQEKLHLVILCGLKKSFMAWLADFFLHDFIMQVFKNA